MKNLKKISMILIILSLSIFSFSCGRIDTNIKIPLIKGPEFNVLNGRVVVTLTIDKIDFNTGVGINIPEMENSEIVVTPRLEGGAIIQAFIDLEDFNNPKLDVVDPQLLPGGRPFPFVAGGALPSLAINSEKLYNSTFYINKNVFSIFIPFEHPIEFDVAQRIKIKSKNVGIIGLLKKDSNNLNSGLLLLLTPKEVEENPAFRKLLKLSKKYKNRRF